MNNTKKQRKTIEWKRLEISLRKLEIPREHYIKIGTIKGKNDKELMKEEEIKKR